MECFKIYQYALPMSIDMSVSRALAEINGLVRKLYKELVERAALVINGGVRVQASEARTRNPYLLCAYKLAV